MSPLRAFCRAVGLVAVLSVSLAAADVSDLIKTIKQLGPEGKGNAAAAAAWNELAQAGPDVLIELLSALDDTHPLAANTLRSAVETIAQRAIEKQQPLPAKELEAFLKDREKDPAARKLAFDLLVKLNPETRERLVPGMVDDPNVELRREAIARLIEQANTLAKTDKNAARPIYEQAMANARDDDQVKVLVEKLFKDYMVKIDLQKHFGFVTTWHVIAPFDNTQKKGFNVAYPPEKSIDLKAELEGKQGQKVTWVPYTTPDAYGVVDLKKPLMEHYKGSVAYAYAEFETDRDRQVDVRLGTDNAWKVWVNDTLLFARDEYHRGDKLDQYKMKANLKAGKNRILVKICQNEQTEDWAQKWQFQIRVCDASGTAILPARSVAKNQTKGGN